MQTRKHIQSLLTHISQGLYEKDHIIALALLCAISGENLFLLGPPGTAKSEVARRLKMVFHDATAFEYLMSRFSTPDEIFGPVSIQKLKQEDTYQRKVDGFLPAATIVFLDEIWKAGPAIQNALLTVINEKIYQNGSSTIHVPMKCLIAASNELPAEDEGLEALWDRFIMRVVSNCISDERTFYKMLTMAEMPQITIPDELKITDQLFLDWQQQIKAVAVPKHILKAITAIRKQLATAAEGEEVEPLDFYISDRRWRKNIQILRTSAFLNGRQEIDYTDLFLLIHTLWNKVEYIEQILQIVIAAIFADITHEADSIKAACDKLKKQNMAADTEPTDYKVFDLFYYALRGFPKGKCYFYARDYKHIPIQSACPAVLYYDDAVKAHVIRKYDKNTRSADTAGKQNVLLVQISKYNDTLIVDGTPYPFITKGSDLPLLGSIIQKIESKFDNSLTTRATDLIALLQTRIQQLKASTNLFLSKDDHQLIMRQAEKLDKQLNVLLTNIKTL